MTMTSEPPSDRPIDLDLAHEINTRLAALERDFDSSQPDRIEQGLEALLELTRAKLPRETLRVVWYNIGIGYQQLLFRYGRLCGDKSVRAFLAAARISADAMFNDSKEAEFLQGCLFQIAAVLTGIESHELLEETEAFLTDQLALPLLQANANLRAMVALGLGEAHLQLADDAPRRSVHARRAVDHLEAALQLEDTPDSLGSYHDLFVRENLVQAELLCAAGPREVGQAVDTALEVDRKMEAASYSQEERNRYRGLVISMLYKAQHLNDGADIWLPALRLRIWRAWAGEFLAQVERETADKLTGDQPLVSRLSEDEEWLQRLFFWEADSVVSMLGVDAELAPSRFWDAVTVGIDRLSSRYGYPYSLLLLCLKLGLERAGIAMPAPAGSPSPRPGRSRPKWPDSIKTLIADLLHNDVRDPEYATERLMAVLDQQPPPAQPVRMVIMQVIDELLRRGVEDDGALAYFKVADVTVANCEPSPELAHRCYVLSDAAMVRNRPGYPSRWPDLSAEWARKALGAAKSQSADFADNPMQSHFLGMISIRALARMAYCDVLHGRAGSQTREWLSEAEELTDALTASGSRDPEIDYQRKYLAYIGVLAEGTQQQLFEAVCELQSVSRQVPPQEALRAAIEIVSLALYATTEARARWAVVVRSAAELIIVNLDPPPHLREAMAQALVVLSLPSIQDLASIDASRLDELATVAQRLSEQSGADVTDALMARFAARWQGNFQDANEVADVLAACDLNIREGRINTAILLMTAWLTSRFNVSTVGGPVRFLTLEHRIARQLLALALVGRADPEVLRRAAYTVGETARLVDNHVLSERWLSLVIDTVVTDTADAETISFRDAYIADRLSNRLEQACKEGDRSTALQVIHERIDHGSDRADKKIDLSGRLSNLTVYMRYFPAEDVRDLVLSTCEEAERTGSLSGQHEPLLLIDIMLAKLRLGTQLADTALLTETEQRVTELLASMPMSAELEATLRDCRVRCLAELGRIEESSTDLQRLVHIQDRMLGTARELTHAHYPDVSRDTLKRAASAAFEESSPALAIDVLEQDRLRLLTGLRHRVVRAPHA
jgi:hypothetical protein